MFAKVLTNKNKNQMIEIATGLYIVKSKILKLRIYQKDGKTKVAITLDTVNKDESTAFSAELSSLDEAKTFCLNIGSSLNN